MSRVTNLKNGGPPFSSSSPSLLCLDSIQSILAFLASQGVLRVCKCKVYSFNFILAGLLPQFANCTVIFSMLSTRSGSYGGRHSLSGREVLPPSSIQRTKRLWESKFHRIRIAKDIYKTWNTLKSESTFDSDSLFVADLLSLELRRRER